MLGEEISGRVPAIDTSSTATSICQGYVSIAPKNCMSPSICKPTLKYCSPPWRFISLIGMDTLGVEDISVTLGAKLAKIYSPRGKLRHVNQDNNMLVTLSFSST